ncbi:hypothetical protein V6N12_026894 [Hibiscus sabdariffa]|uniref:Uncharacterized protein n=1 Tax=Hibiscus sabdariffa TaxID=183260 RepID=A0ABR2DUM5_9ROSI
MWWRQGKLACISRRVWLQLFLVEANSPEDPSEFALSTPHSARLNTEFRTLFYIIRAFSLAGNGRDKANSPGSPGDPGEFALSPLGVFKNTRPDYPNT